MKIVFLGLSITSSWGNGHATTYRGLVRELARRGHHVTFLERNMPWYAQNRDLPNPPYGKTCLYDHLDELGMHYESEIGRADLVVVGSYVPEGVAVAERVFKCRPRSIAFYDIDTPVTLQKLDQADYEYLSPRHIPQFDIYLSFNGGPVLHTLERRWGAQRARPLYCSADLEVYYPEHAPVQWDLGYMGTYSSDRQPALERLLLGPATTGRGKFVVAGPCFPPEIQWPPNVERLEHVPPHQHRAFYNAQRFTLNVTRAQMVNAGYAPSIRLFEAAACATPVISDQWQGLEEFFAPGEEILVASNPQDSIRFLWHIKDSQRREIGFNARRRILKEHTAAHRAAQLEAYALEILADDVQNEPDRAVTGCYGYAKH